MEWKGMPGSWEKEERGFFPLDSWKDTPFSLETGLKRGETSPIFSSHQRRQWGFPWLTKRSKLHLPLTSRWVHLWTLVGHEEPRFPPTPPTTIKWGSRPKAQRAPGLNLSQGEKRMPLNICRMPPLHHGIIAIPPPSGITGGNLQTSSCTPTHDMRDEGQPQCARGAGPPRYGNCLRSCCGETDMVVCDHWWGQPRECKARTIRQIVVRKA